MAQLYTSCGEFIATSTGTLPVYMFQEDFERIKNWVLSYPNLETGGDLFGLWASDKHGLNPLIHVVLGPGEGCKRTEYSFFQDVRYLKRVGSTLTETYMLGHIGEWHSHHGLSLFEPSMGDYNTVSKNYPHGFHGFLLLIANILPNSEVVLSPYMFRQGTNKVERCGVQLLAGNSPFRREDAIKGAIERGAEVATRHGVQATEVRPARPNRARVTAAGTGQSKFTKHSPIVTKPTSNSNSRERPKYGNARVSDTTIPETRQIKPGAPDDVQWYLTKDGRAELQRIRQSFERIDGVKELNHYHNSNNMLCFEFKRKFFRWIIEFPSNYPHGKIVLKSSFGNLSDAPIDTNEISGTDYSANMTRIISKVRR